MADLFEGESGGKKKRDMIVLVLSAIGAIGAIFFIERSKSSSSGSSSGPTYIPVSAPSSGGSGSLSDEIANLQTQLASMTTEPGGQAWSSVPPNAETPTSTTTYPGWPMVNGSTTPVNTSTPAAASTPSHATTVTTQTPQVKPPSYPTYTVSSGQSLWGISSLTLGSGSKWQEIYNLNKSEISNPNLIYPGEKLRLPPGAKVA
jgi:LysM repeat protein